MSGKLNKSSDLGFPLVFKFLITCCSMFIFFCYFLYKTGRVFAQRYFFLPPTDFRETFEKGCEKSNGLLPSSKIGIKTASFRRRLIMAGKKPQVYSTLPLNSINTKTKKPVNNIEKKYYTLRIADIDRSPENKNNFLMNIKPINASDNHRRKLFGFFHPFSYALGGGEKVLWEAIIATLEEDINNIAIVYTFTPSTDSSVFSILNGVKETFGIDFLRDDRKYLTDRIVFIHLPDKYNWLINGNSYLFLSMIGQALGSIILIFLGFQQVTPDIFIDTIGIPFTYSFVYGFLDLSIISYIHYPTVSRDMLKAAQQIGGIYGLLKYSYWWIILKLYTLNIIWVNIALFNSTWTAENVNYSLGSISEEIEVDENILYPPCVSYDDKTFDKKINNINLIKNKREKNIVYLAQFRPEKRHLLLIQHYKEYLNQFKDKGIKEPYKLIFIGAVRLNKDENYIQEIKAMIKKLEISDNLIKFELNAPNSTVENILQNSDFGINCMWKEHFGIAVVEYMLNGAIPLVHASAGPLEDIVVPFVNGHSLKNKELKKHLKVKDDEKSGLFFRDETDPDFNSANVETYPTLTEMLLTASNLTEVTKLKIRENAISVAKEKFGRGVFSKRWSEYIIEITEIETKRREARGNVEQLY